MTSWTRKERDAERVLRAGIRTSLTDWATMVLAEQGQVPARHHRMMIAELESVAAGECDRLMLLLPPGSAKSTYASLNVLIGTLGAMATNIVGYWVGSSVGSARKDERLALREAG